MKCRQIVSLVTALVCAALFSAVALAGEAKNQAPFTRVVAPTQTRSITGEPKNMPPFTTRVFQPRVVPDWLERYAAAHPYGREVVATAAIASASGGFRWRDAFVGAAAATAAFLLLVGLGIGRSWRRSQIAQTAGA